MKSARALERIFKSTFNKDFEYVFYLYLFSISLITAWFWELLSSPLSNADLKLDIRKVLRSSQKTSKKTVITGRFIA